MPLGHAVRLAIVATHSAARACRNDEQAARPTERAVSAPTEPRTRASVLTAVRSQAIAATHSTARACRNGEQAARPTDPAATALSPPPRRAALPVWCRGRPLGRSRCLLVAVPARTCGTVYRCDRARACQAPDRPAYRGRHRHCDRAHRPAYRGRHRHYAGLVQTVSVRGGGGLPGTSYSYRL